MKLSIGNEAGNEVGIEANNEVGIEANNEVGIEANNEVGIEAKNEVGIEASILAMKGEPGFCLTWTPSSKDRWRAAGCGLNIYI